MLTPRDQLLTSHDEFRRLAQEHSQYSQRLDSLTQKRYLSEDEKLGLANFPAARSAKVEIYLEQGAMKRLFLFILT